MSENRVEVLIETYWNVNLEMWCEKLGGSSY